MNPKQLKLCLPVPLSVNQYLQPKGNIKTVKGKTFVDITMYQNPKAKEYKETVKYIIRREANRVDWNSDITSDQHYYVDVDVYFERTDRDSDNIFKILFDTITESNIIWKDDRYGLPRVNKVCYNSEFPHIDVTITPVEYIGIFDNEDQLNQFKKQCETCNRRDRNCTVLRKAKEGRISDDIEDLECLRYKERKGTKKS